MECYACVFSLWCTKVGVVCSNFLRSKISVTLSMPSSEIGWYF